MELPKITPISQRRIAIHHGYDIPLDNWINSAGIKITDTTWADNTVYDVSGFGNNGTVTGTLKNEVDSPRYSVSTYFDGTGSNYVTAASLPSETKTISVWVKGALGGSQIAFADFNTQMSLGLHGTRAVIVHCSSGTNGSTGSRVLLGNNWKTNQWNHFGIIKTGTGTYTVYLNGVQLVPDSVNYWTHTANLMIGRRNYASLFWKGQISDFRAYATALSEEDIIELYQTSASIDKNGNMYSYEFVEEV